MVEGPDQRRRESPLPVGSELGEGGSAQGGEGGGERRHSLNIVEKFPSHSLIVSLVLTSKLLSISVSSLTVL